VLEASKEVDLEVNAEKTECMVVSDHQSAGQIQKVLTANKSLENVKSSNILERQ